MRSHKFFLIGLFLPLLIIGFVSFTTHADTIPYYKLAVTYYDFHDDGSCPEFEQYNKWFKIGKHHTVFSRNMIMPVLDADKKPIANPNDTLGWLYLDMVARIDRWYRPWKAGDTITWYRFPDSSTTEVPIDQGIPGDPGNYG